MRFRVLIIMLLTLAAQQLVRAQSTTTGTLNLRNGQPATVSLSIPTTGVSGYSILLPPQAGLAGDLLTLQSLTGTTAQLGWSSSQYWSLTGSAITTAGTGAGEQYLGTSTAMDLVVATNATEQMRLIGTAGPTQGFLGIGTSTPTSRVDVRGDLTLSSAGAASRLRFAEPQADGSNITTFSAAAQSADINYTLPPAAAAADGMVLTSNTTGALSWQSPLASVGRGQFTPTAGSWVHTVATPGFDLQPGAAVLVSVQNAPGTTIAASVTAVDATGDSFTVETSVGLAASDRILWVAVNP
jgi:hypothetical protein